MRKAIVRWIVRALRVNVDPLVSQSHRHGKGYMQYNQYILQVKSGKKAMVIGMGYVVLSDNMYKKLLKDAKEFEYESMRVTYDELQEFESK